MVKGGGNEDWVEGLEHFRESSNQMDALMGFLVIYIRKVHCDRYFVKLLVNNPGSSYVDVVTASDIAYAATLLKSSGEVWADKVENEGKVSKKSNKTLFTSGKGKKRTLGTSMWNEDGMEFYDRALANWKPCYTGRKVLSTSVLGTIGISGSKRRVRIWFSIVIA